MGCQGWVTHNQPSKYGPKPWFFMVSKAYGLPFGGSGWFWTVIPKGGTRYMVKIDDGPRHLVGRPIAVFSKSGHFDENPYFDILK